MLTNGSTAMELVSVTSAVRGSPPAAVLLIDEDGTGSAPLRAETHCDFEKRTGHRILERYGMSETGMITSNPIASGRRPGTVGFALPGVFVRVVGDADQPLAVGEKGAIQVKGENVFGAYWRMPEKTRQEFTGDGWFRTGDIGVFDSDGYLSIVGRTKDLIITGGYNVYPKEIELLLDELPEIAESAVIGVPHEEFGEEVKAVVQAVDPGHGAADLEAELKERYPRTRSLSIFNPFLEKAEGISNVWYMQSAYRKQDYPEGTVAVFEKPIKLESSGMWAK